MESISLPPGTFAAEPVARVGFWPRVAAAIIDTIVVFALGFVLAPLAASLFADGINWTIAQQTASQDPRVVAQMAQVQAIMTKWTQVSVAATLVALIYNLLEALAGRALGKMVMGLRIAGADGSPGANAKLFARYALKQSGAALSLLALLAQIKAFSTISMILGLAVCLGFFAVLTRRRQALHDLVAGTAVFHKSDVGAAAPAAAAHGT